MVLVSFAFFTMTSVDWRLVLRDRIAYWFLALSISAFVSATWTIDRTMSLFGNWRCPSGFLVLFSYLVLYLFAKANIKTQKDRNAIIKCAIGCGIIVSIYALLQSMGYDFMTWNGTLNVMGFIRPMSTLGHPNFMAGYLVMLLPFVFWFIQNSKKIVIKAILFVVSCLFIADIFFSQSRGMWHAMAISCATYLLLNRAAIKRFVPAIVIMVVVAASIVITVPNFVPGVKERLQTIVGLGEARTEYWIAAIRMWKRSPWIGIGTDAYETAFQHQRTARYWEIESRGSPHKAHNDFLNMLATQGIFGAVAWLAVLICAFSLAKKSQNPMRSAIIASLVAFYIEGLSSFTVCATGTLFTFLLALL